MEVKIVLGYALGDEGKGVTTQWLCKKAIEEGKKPLVVRFSGGPQAAHTINHNGVEHICSSFGSGVLLGVPTMLLDDVYIDPISLVKEYDVLVSKGIEPKIMITAFNRIITPHDVLAGRSNAKVLRDGTCGKGIYATFERYSSREDIQYTSHILFREGGPKAILHQAAEYHRLDELYYEDDFLEARDRLGSIIDMSDSKWSRGYDVLIFEGTQGLLLDMDCGIHPYLTPSRVGLNGINPIYLNEAEVYLVTRTYFTSHCKGHKPKCKLNADLQGKHETNVHNDYQGNFMVGALDTPIMNRAADRHRIDNYLSKYNCNLNLVITHMDVIMENGLFEYLAGHNIKCIKGKNLTPCAVANAISQSLDLPFDNVYYNDSIESNIKQVTR